jgi:tetratricopeptide (TPR) repeat protein
MKNGMICITRMVRTLTCAAAGFVLASAVVSVLVSVTDAEVRTAIEVKLATSDAKAHYDLGFALMNKGDLDGAIRAYRQAVKIRPDDADAHYNLGLVLNAKDDRAGAVQVFRAYLRLNVDEQLKQRARDLIHKLGSAP